MIDSGGELRHRFWIGGFEGADHINRHGEALDMNALSGHAELLEGDFARVVSLGIRRVRESIGWRLASETESGGYDFSRTVRVAECAAAHDIEVLWTLMHYGKPSGLALTDPAFVGRFAEFAALAARTIRRVRGRPSTYTPINEIGFLAWAHGESDVLGDSKRGTSPPLSGFEAKCRLVAASLAAVEAIRAEDPGAVMLHIEPLIQVVAAFDHPHLADHAAAFTAYQWQALDMLLGRANPELGGSATAVDVIGVNHYHDAQWEVPSMRALAWNPPDPRRTSFRALLTDIWQRYRLPLIVGETSHFGEGRATWLKLVVDEVTRALSQGVRIEGVCLYPVVDRPDWNDVSHWHRSGLWDANEGVHARLGRRLSTEYAHALRECQYRLQSWTDGLACASLP